MSLTEIHVPGGMPKCLLSVAYRKSVSVAMFDVPTLASLLITRARRISIRGANMMRYGEGEEVKLKIRNDART